MRRLPTSHFSFVTEPRGFSVAEAVVAAAILVTGMTAVLAAYTAYDRASSAVLSSVQASTLAEQGLEAVGLLRDMSWSATLGSFATGTPYFVVETDGAWSATTTPTMVDGAFYRTVTFTDAMRDVDGNLVAQGTADPHARLVTSAVSWWSASKNATSTVTLQAYLTDLFNH